MSIAVQTKPPVHPDGEGQEAPLVSVVIPCLNEAENIESCVTQALEAILRMGVPGEVVVVDNGSEDDSALLLRDEYPEVRLLELRANPATRVSDGTHPTASGTGLFAGVISRALHHPVLGGVTR